MKKEQKNELKYMIVATSLILLYLLSSDIAYFILNIFGIKYSSLNGIIKSIYSIVIELSIITLISYVYKDEIIKSFNEFKKNFKSLMDKYFKYWILMLILMMISSSIISNFTVSETANNQNSIIDILKTNFIYTAFITAIVAPILEELVFRFTLKKMFKNSNIVFIIMSGLFFGSLHVIGSFNYIQDLLFIIPYSIPGFIFAYVYTKSKNIFVPITLHSIHNTVMILLQLLIIII